MWSSVEYIIHVIHVCVSARACVVDVRACICTLCAKYSRAQCVNYLLRKWLNIVRNECS